MTGQCLKGGSPKLRDFVCICMVFFFFLLILFDFSECEISLSYDFLKGYFHIFSFLKRILIAHSLGDFQTLVKISKLYIVTHMENIFKWKSTIDLTF